MDVDEHGPAWASVDTNMDRGHRQSERPRDRQISWGRLMS